MGTRLHRRGTRIRVATAGLRLAVGLAVALAACGTDTREQPGTDPSGADPSSDSPPGGNPPGETSPAGPGPLTVLTPADGDVVSVPFEVNVAAGIELGAIEDGLHHLHIWFDDTQAAPEVVTAATATVGGDEIPAPTGETTMFVQLHTAEHEPIGEVISIPLTVNGGSDSGDPGYTY